MVVGVLLRLSNPDVDLRNRMFLYGLPMIACNTDLAIIFGICIGMFIMGLIQQIVCKQ